MSLLVDTGPLVAWIDGRDRWHEWARGALGDARPPLLTCEAVLAEACFILRHVRGGADSVLAMCERGALQPAFDLGQEVVAVRALLSRYANVPMSLADGCLVRMCELRGDLDLVTLDSDFRIYRRNGRRTLQLRMPSELG